MSASSWTTCPGCQAEDSLREDYEFYGAATGTVSYYYSALCTSCGLAEDFKGKQDIVPPATSKENRRKLLLMLVAHSGRMRHSDIQPRVLAVAAAHAVNDGLVRLAAGDVIITTEGRKWPDAQD